MTSGIKAFTPPQRLRTAAMKVTLLPKSQPSAHPKPERNMESSCCDRHVCRSPSAPIRVTVSSVLCSPQGEASPWQKLKCIQSITAKGTEEGRALPAVLRGSDGEQNAGWGGACSRCRPHAFCFHSHRFSSEVGHFRKSLVSFFPQHFRSVLLKVI